MFLGSNSVDRNRWLATLHVHMFTWPITDGPERRSQCVQFGGISHPELDLCSESIGHNSHRGRIQ